MSCRRHGKKPTLALWMLVALADIAIIAAAAGPVMVLLVTAGLAAAGGFYIVRNLGNRTASPAKAVARRRA
ncbi:MULTISPECIES: hypothetical protein [Actinoplanes]|uniref:Uncharacterized protein n=2 Tax=Actinoplanes TaxID=1865 RepID=A0A101J829_9ACTN|nr:MULTISPECIES: hypothetical protein [Actinoplanes]KUL21946.1 hypothetical protein ADL15_49650 [Actinoplanes awajinensis subsp. mycoplanecinus]GIE65156.1 hypothetical protein Apa02nite_012640 [Actinoplanes palleronii]